MQPYIQLLGINNLATSWLGWQCLHNWKPIPRSLLLKVSREWPVLASGMMDKLQEPRLQQQYLFPDWKYILPPPSTGQNYIKASSKDILHTPEVQFFKIYWFLHTNSKHGWKFPNSSKNFKKLLSSHVQQLYWEPVWYHGWSARHREIGLNPPLDHKPVLVPLGKSHPLCLTSLQELVLMMKLEHQACCLQLIGGNYGQKCNTCMNKHL